MAESEIRIRKEVLRTYNLRRENFPDLKEYNDFLEQVEDIIYDLAYSNDNELKQRRQREIEEFKQKNKSIIAKNRALQEDEYKRKRLEEERKKLEEEERKQKEQRHAHLQEIAQQEREDQEQIQSFTSNKGLAGASATTASGPNGSSLQQQGLIGNSAVVGGYQASTISSQYLKRQPEPKFIPSTANTPYNKLSKEDQRRFEMAVGFRPVYILERAYEEGYHLFL
ncbi:hypothetical protein ABK040_003330 [Willaertia magna]